MKKYVNGKIVDMTEADIARAKARAMKNRESQNTSSHYENRIKELEATVTTLLNKLETSTESEEKETVEE